MTNKRIEAVENVVFTDEQKVVKKFKFHHKVIFAFIVFLGAVLLWYGVWTIVSDIPIISNPYIATILGFIVLLATGAYYDNTL